MTVSITAVGRASGLSAKGRGFESRRFRLILRTNQFQSVRRQPMQPMGEGSSPPAGRNAARSNFLLRCTSQL